MKKSVLLGGVGAVVTISAVIINYAVTRQEAAVEPVASVPLRPAASAGPVAQSPEATAAVQPSATAAAQPVVTTAPATEADAAPAAADASTDYPEFDIVRINPSGDAVIAGRAAAGSLVTLLRDGQPIDKVTADERGEWVLLPGVGVLQGAREITLSSQLDGEPEMRSKQVVVLVNPDGTKAAGDGPLALLMAGGQKGGATVLQTPGSAGEGAALEAAAAAPQADPATAAPAASPEPAAPEPAATEPATVADATAPAAPPAALEAPLVEPPVSEAATPDSVMPDPPVPEPVATDLESVAAAALGALPEAAAEDGSPDEITAEGRAAQALAMADSGVDAVAVPIEAPALPEPLEAEAPAAAVGSAVEAQAPSGPPPTPLVLAPLDAPPDLLAPPPVEPAAAPAGPAASDTLADIASAPAPDSVPQDVPAADPQRIAAIGADGGVPAPVAPPPASARAADDAAAAEEQETAETAAASSANAHPVDPEPDAVADEGRMPTLTARPAVAEGGVLVSGADFVPEPRAAGPGARAIVANAAPPVEPDAPLPVPVETLPPLLERLKDKMAHDDPAPPTTAEPAPLAAGLLGKLPSDDPASSMTAEVRASQPTGLVLVSTAPLRQTPLPPTTPDQDALSVANLEIDMQADAQPAAVISPTVTLRGAADAATRGDEADVPVAGAQTGRGELSDDVVTIAALTGDPDDVLGGASYRQASVQTDLPAAKDAVQLLMAEAQSVLQDAAEAQQAATGAAGQGEALPSSETADAATAPTATGPEAEEQQVAMAEPAAPASAVTEQGALAPAEEVPDLQLGSFQRDQAPLTLAMTEAGGTPDAQPVRGEGIRSGTVVLDSVDYDEHGEVVIGGQATPNSPLNIYVDNEHVGSAIAGQTGRWTVTPSKPLSLGVHYLRVDQVEDGGHVVARVESPFARVEPIAVESGDARVVVQPGNSLWRIARRALQDGERFTAIYEANRSQIADPDMIYPGQVFVVPSPETASSQ